MPRDLGLHIGAIVTRNGDAKEEVVEFVPSPNRLDEFIIKPVLGGSFESASFNPSDLMRVARILTESIS